MADMSKWFKRSVYGVVRVYTNADLAKVTEKEKGVMRGDPIKYKFKSLLDCVLIGEKTTAFRDVSLVKRNFSEPIRYEDIKAIRLLEENWSHPYNTIEIDVPNREEPWRLHFNKGDFKLALEVFKFMDDKRGEKRRIEEGHRQREEDRNIEVLKQNEVIISLLKDLNNNQRAPQNDVILAMLEKKLDGLLDQLKELQSENDQLKKEIKELKEQRQKDQETERKPENSKEARKAEQDIDQGFESVKKKLADQKEKVENFEEGLNEYKQALEQLEQTETQQEFAPQMQKIRAIDQKLQQFKQAIEELEQEVGEETNRSDFERKQPEQKMHSKKGVDRKFRDAETALKVLQVGLKDLRSKEATIRQLAPDKQNKLLEIKWKALEEFRNRELSIVQEAEINAIVEGREFDSARLGQLMEEVSQHYSDLSQFEQDLQKQPEQEEPARMSKEEWYEPAENTAKSADTPEIENNPGGTGRESRRTEQSDHDRSNK